MKGSIGNVFPIIVPGMPIPTTFGLHTQYQQQMQQETVTQQTTTQAQIATQQKVNIEGCNDNSVNNKNNVTNINDIMQHQQLQQHHTQQNTTQQTPVQLNMNSHPKIQITTAYNPLFLHLPGINPQSQAQITPNLVASAATTTGNTVTVTPNTGQLQKTPSQHSVNAAGLVSVGGGGGGGGGSQTGVTNETTADVSPQPPATNILWMTSQPNMTQMVKNTHTKKKKNGC